MYKRNGFYYIFAPAGGVPAGWQTVLRSKQIFGPYEDKIVLHQGNTPVNGPHQGGWVELESGESWFMHFQDAGAYGRIVHLQPVKWADDWPSMGEDYNADGIGEPVMTCRKPDVGATYPVAVPQTSDDFDSDQAGLQWQWHANTKENWYSLTARKSYMRLYAINPSLNNEQITLWDAPNLLLQKFPAPCFAATTRLDFSGAAFQDKAGLIVMGQEYAFIALNKTLTDIRLILVKGEGVEDLRRETVVTSVVLSSPTVYLRVNVQQDNERRAHCTFCYSLDGDTYTDLEYLFEAKPGKWLGSKTGIFCCNLEQTASTGYADFDSFVCS
jgi:beta-xylosidase